MQTIVITPELNEKLIVSILTDSILWFRLTDQIANMHRVFNPEYNTAVNLEPNNQIHGYTTAFLAMGISENDKLVDELTAIYFDFTVGLTPDNAHDLAEIIFYEWVYTVNNFNSKKSA